MSRTNSKDSGTAKIPMSKSCSLSPELEEELAYQQQYKAIFGSIIYLITNKPDIMYSTCLCVRFQAAPKLSHIVVA